jgi:glycerol-3-phosphate acyltransferase PlsX
MAAIRIAIDAMGGDYAPAHPVTGAIQALETCPPDQLDVVLVGDQACLEAELKKSEFDHTRLQVVHAQEKVEFAESATQAIKSHPNSSISQALDLHLRQEVQGVVSAGHTGVQVALSLLKLGRIEGVRRPTIGAMFPGDNGGSFLLDVGANTDCKPYHLVQFAAMGSIFVSRLKNIKNPKVGLLSIGEEKTKGNTLTKQAHELLSVCPINFIGNVEGRDIVRGKADVIVCDGYVGNILLKFAETIFYVINERLGDAFNSISSLEKASLFSSIRKDFDYQEYGGVPLLGINGVSVICHGTSSPKAICNAILVAKNMVQDQIVQRIKDAIETYHVGIFTRGMVRLKDWRSFQEWREKMELRDLERK